LTNRPPNTEATAPVAPASTDTAPPRAEAAMALGRKAFVVTSSVFVPNATAAVPSARSVETTAAPSTSDSPPIQFVLGCANRSSPPPVSESVPVPRTPDEPSFMSSPCVSTAPPASLSDTAMFVATHGS
jgi:hypothetical protein